MGPAPSGHPMERRPTRWMGTLDPPLPARLYEEGWAVCRSCPPEVRDAEGRVVERQENVWPRALMRSGYCRDCYLARYRTRKQELDRARRTRARPAG